MKQHRKQTSQTLMLKAKSFTTTLSRPKTRSCALLPRRHPQQCRISSIRVVESASGLSTVRERSRRASCACVSGPEATVSRARLTTSKKFRTLPIRKAFDSDDAFDSTENEESEKKPRLSLLQGYLSGIAKTLQDFGVSRRSIWEGGVGLFIATSIAAVLAIISWIVGTRPGRYLSSYNFTVSFPVAYGLSIGTPVRIRGVNVGSVVGIKPSITSVDTVIEIKDQGIAIPKDSKIEINQLGLIAETMIDITPKDTKPEFRSSPLDAECAKEGVLVCHRSAHEGKQGVSMDEFILICTKLAKEMEAGGLDTALAAAGSAIDIIERSRPLVKEAIQLAKEVTPILQELNKQEMVGTVEELLSVASKTVEDINHMNKIILTEDNLLLLRESVGTLLSTLKNIENISGSVSGLTGDSATQANIKQLIQSLSRIIVD